MEADIAETETPIGQARKRFYEAGRALAVALKDADNVDPNDGERIAGEFVDAFDAMEALSG